MDSGQSGQVLTPTFLLSALLLGACSGDTETSGDSDASTSTLGDSGSTAFEPDPTESVGGVEEGWPKPCSDLYTQSELPTFSLDFVPQDWADLQSACDRGSQAYHPVQFSYDGETVDAQVRLKGNWSWDCDKLQFVISFNEEDPDARFHGLRKVMLDAPWYDHTLLHERLAFPLFEARGLPYSCANNARLNVNGNYYGLYANLERVDHEYLERNWENPDGNLYQGGVELKTNEDVGDTSNLEALQAARTVDQIAALMDLDQAVAEWAMEAMIPAMDNYWAGVEINYYLYDHPSLGFVYIPYDLDISWGDAAYSDGSLVWPDSATVDPITYEHTGWGKEALVETVLAAPQWCRRFVEELELARAVYDPAALVAQVEQWDAQIGDALIEDTHKTFSDARHTAAVSHLKGFFGERAAFVDQWLAAGNHCPGGG
jgi:hypothetical protein